MPTTERPVDLLSSEKRRLAHSLRQADEGRRNGPVASPDPGAVDADAAEVPIKLVEAWALWAKSRFS